MSNYNNVNRVLIGDGTNDGAITHISGIQKGDLFLINENNVVVATVADAKALPRFEKVTIASGIGSGLAILSSPIQGNTVSKFEGKTFADASEQVVILGYNGGATTGINVAASIEYRLRVLIKDSHRPNGMRQTLSDVNYTSGVSETASEVASKIASLYGQKDLSENYMSDKVKLERVSDGTFAAADNGVAVVKGSKVITFTTAATHGTGTAFAIGDDIRIGGTGVAVPVYKITAVDGLKITLDVPFVGETAAIAAANVGNLASTTKWGFKLTALAQESNINNGANAPLDEYEWINFDAVFSTADDLSSTQESAIYTLVTPGNPGQGYWKQVADREEAAKGYFGDTSKRRFYDKRIESTVVVGGQYSSVVITHAAAMNGDFQGTYSAPLQTEIYIPTTSAQAVQSTTGSNTAFLAILNGYFSHVLGFTVIPTL